MVSKHTSSIESWDLNWNNDKQNIAASTANNAASWFIELIRPSIMTRATTPSPKRRAIRWTAYLDGLRGFAAFLVYWQHHQLWPLRSVPSSRILENAYGFEDRYYFATLPGIRIFFTGSHFAVALFFVISGYVLSTKPLSLLYSRDFTQLGDNLGSAIFRRYLRLHIPVIIVTFVYMTSWHLFGIWVQSPEQNPIS